MEHADRNKQKQSIEFKETLNFMRFFNTDHIKKGSDNHVKGICIKWRFMACSFCKPKKSDINRQTKCPYCRRDRPKHYDRLPCK